MNRHKYSVGQRVTFAGRTGRNAPSGEYEIVRLMPAEAGQYLYRIRGAAELWERVVPEDQLDTRS